jgi:hypothetical protein
MKTKKNIFYCAVLLLAGCLPSLHQLYNDETLIFKEELIGKWMGDDDGIWQFKKAGDKEYELRIYDDEKELGRFSAHLTQIEGLMFLDLFPDTEPLDDLDDFYKIHILPVHTFMRVDQINPRLQLRMIDYEKVEKLIENDPDVIKHEVVDDDRIVLTAGTEELQDFVIEHVETIFYDDDDSSGAIRLDPLYSDDNIIVDPSFIGQWKDKDGGLLYSKGMGEKSYEMTYEGIDGTEQKVFAYLLRLHDNLLMAVFADKAELDPNQPNAYTFHLIPDWILRVKKTESELVLQQLGHKEVLEAIQRNNPLPELQPEDASYSFKGKRIEP